MATFEGYTTNYSFGLINFDVATWHDAEHDNWRLLDAILLSVMGATTINKGVWQNSTVYAVDDRVVDADLGGVYICQVAHTSSASGDFAAHRTANPTHWDAALDYVQAADTDNDTLVVVERTADDDHLRFVTAGVDRMTITDAGKVGVGITSSMQGLVHIVESTLASAPSSSGVADTLVLEHATAVGIQFFSATTASIYFGDVANNGTGRIVYDHSTDTMHLRAGGTNALNIEATRLLPQVQIQSPNGTVGAPTYSFSNDPDTGMYSVAANELGFATAGVKRLGIDATSMDVIPPLRIGDGSVANPSFGFLNDIDTGFRWGGSGIIQFVTNAAAAFTIYGGSVRNVDGAVNIPAYTFISDADTGMFRVGADNLALVVGGVNTIDLQTTTVTVKTTNSPLVLNSTLGTNYKVEWQNNGTRLGFIGADGTAAFAVYDNSGNALLRTIQSNGQMRFKDGSAAVPTLTFIDDFDVGMYRAGANDLGFAVGGADCLRLQAGGVDYLTINAGSGTIFMQPEGSTADIEWQFRDTTGNVPFRIQNSKIGFFNTTAVGRQPVSGARNDDEQALKNLLGALATYGFITDNTTAT